MAYSYNDGDLYYFMDQETYEHGPPEQGIHSGRRLPASSPRTTVCKVLSYKGKRLWSWKCPNFMDLEVTETEPGLAGNTATNTTQARHRGDRR